MMKNYCQIVEGGPEKLLKNYCQIVEGGPEEKCMEEAERQPNPTERKEKKEGRFLRGQISMDGKKGNQITK